MGISRCPECGGIFPISVPLHQRIEIKKVNGKKVAYPCTYNICQCDKKDYGFYIVGAAKKWNKRKKWWDSLTKKQQEEYNKEVEEWADNSV